jgi:integrase
VRKTLTDRLVRAKYPTGGKHTDVVWDAALTGFGMRIGGTGRTYFIQSRVNGNLFKMKVGRVRLTDKDTAALSVADARKKAGELLAMALAGRDPRKVAAAAAREVTLAKLNTFQATSEAYMEEHGQALKSGDEYQRKLDKDILPTLGPIPIAEITRAEIKALFLAKARTAPVAANRMLQVVRCVFNYALDEELLAASPCVRIKQRPEESRSRYLDEAEIKSFWNGLPKTLTAENLQRALKFMLVTGQRSGEVTGLTWSEIDLEKAIWTLPRARTKTNRETLIPLTRLAIELLGPPGEGHIFVSGGGRPYGRRAPWYVMAKHAEILGLTSRATPHDLRRTFASQLGALQIDRLTITKLLNHAEVGLTGQVYDLHDRFEQKRIAMQAWSDELTRIVTGKARPSNVAPLRAVQ